MKALNFVALHDILLNGQYSDEANSCQCNETWIDKMNNIIGLRHSPWNFDPSVRTSRWHDRDLQHVVILPHVANFDRQFSLWLHSHAYKPSNEHLVHWRIFLSPCLWKCSRLLQVYWSTFIRRQPMHVMGKSHCIEIGTITQQNCSSFVCV